MSKMVLVGCKLPHGLKIEHPMDSTKTVELKGKNRAIIIGADYASTEVDADFWEQWIAVNKGFSAIASGAIFVAKSAADASSIAAEYRDRKTGFEAMRTDGRDERAAGVKPADRE